MKSLKLGYSTMTEHIDIMEPPYQDEIFFRINSSPVSMQAHSREKDKFRQLVRDAIKDFQIIFTGEISIIVEWYCDEEKRKTTDKYADIDNIIKPLLDELVGIGGLMIDDSQVQHISCSWLMGGYESEEYIEVRIKGDIDYIERKDDIFLVELKHPVYFPMRVKKYETKENFKLIYNSIISTYKILYEEKVDLPIILKKHASPMIDYGKIHYTRIKNKGFTILRTSEIEDFCDKIFKYQ